MIRVNLLPFRLERKKENIRRQVSVFFLVIVFSLLLLTWYTLGLGKKIEQTRLDIEAVNRQIALYKGKADRVAQIKKDLEVLRNKLAIVDSLKNKRNEHFDLVAELPGRLVPEKMWIEALKADSTKVEIKGVAFDNPTIAEFMKNLEALGWFTQVDLKQSVVRKLNDGHMLKAFELSCMKPVTPEPEETDKKKKKGK